MRNDQRRYRCRNPGRSDKLTAAEPSRFYERMDECGVLRRVPAQRLQRKVVVYAQLHAFLPENRAGYTHPSAPHCRCEAEGAYARSWRWICEMPSQRHGARNAGEQKVPGPPIPTAIPGPVLCVYKDESRSEEERSSLEGAKCVIKSLQGRCHT
jgi:hypothetical protein